MNYEYILALVVLCIVFVIGLCVMKYVRNYKLGNFIFIAVIYLSYLALVLYVYKTDDDPTRWNFLNTLPCANVSPFMFSIMPLLLVLPKKIRAHVYLLVSLLAVGMFFSTLLGCVGNALRGYNFHWHFMLDYIAHIVLALFGIYLILTGQTKPNAKNFIKSTSIIYVVATTMLILNVIFDTSFFGLSLNGKHNIYNMVIVENSYLSAVIYYLGVGIVLGLGYGLCKLIDKDKYRIIYIQAKNTLEFGI